MIQHKKRGEVLQARSPDGAAHAHPGAFFFRDCEYYLSNLSGRCGSVRFVGDDGEAFERLHIGFWGGAGDVLEELRE